MNQEQIVLKSIRNSIKKLPPLEAEAIEELAAFIRLNIKNAGSTVGPYALALVGAEMAADVSGV